MSANDNDALLHLLHKRVRLWDQHVLMQQRRVAVLEETEELVPLLFAELVLQTLEAVRRGAHQIFEAELAAARFRRPGSD